MKKMEKVNLLPLKGFRDYYPEDMAFQSWFYDKVKEVSQSFGFEEYEGPILEPLDLYAAKSGEELVKKQAFTLKGKSGKILALRPEMTPSLARMVAQKAGSLIFPLKWFTYGRRYRYEKPQKGRGREFFQWDIDILGPEGPEADAEIISLAVRLYQKIGLTSKEVRIKVNDRQYLQEKLKTIGISEKKMAGIFKIIDKKTKVNKEAFLKMLEEEGLSKEQVGSLSSLLEDTKGYQDSPWLRKIFATLEKLGVADYVEFDPAIVRGLDYYTRTVIEGWDVKGEFRSIWGGGRYDNLTEDVGGKQKIPGVGFAMGDMVIKEVLKENGKYPKLETFKADILVTVFSPKESVQSIKIANQLRSKEIKTELYLDESVKLDKQLKYADKKGIKYVVIIGPEEVKTEKIVLKNLETGEQVKVSQENMVKTIRKNE